MGAALVGNNFSPIQSKNSLRIRKIKSRFIFRCNFMIYTQKIC